MRSYGALVDGEWLPANAIAEAVATIRSPWDGAELGRVALAPASIIERVIGAAATAFAAAERRPYPLHERIALLTCVAARLGERVDDVAAVLSAEAGKPITQARTEVQRAIATLDATIAAARSGSDNDVPPLDAVSTGADRFAILRRFPIGVVTAITPFNFPINLVMHKVAPALAAGCPVILKPAPQAPLCAFLLAEICVEAGVRRGFLQVVYCDNDTAAPLVDDARIALLSFTGSAKVGWALKARAGRKRVVLELGGNAAVVIEDCADMKAVAERIAVASNAYAGQTCISVQRVLVRESLANELRGALRDATSRLEVGDPALASTVVGPVIDDRAAERIEAWIESAAAGGATVHGELARRGRLLHPVIVEGVPDDHPLLAEEVFGPVTTFETYRDFAAAIDRVNQSVYGLQAGVYVRDVELLLRAHERMQVGAVIHDDCPTFRVDAMPYGGEKDSGQGREGPRYAIEDMTEPRLLVLRRGRPTSS